MRLRIDLAYDGGDFHGWAVQPGLRTAQGELETALATVLRVPEAPTVCAGRTDTGVHARGQVVHVDVADDALVAAAGRSKGSPHEDVTRRLNGVLPPDLRVRRVVTAAPGFDARFSPLWRRYAYRITDGVPDPLTRGHVVPWARPLDVDAMNDASGHLLGLHDFASFCKRREGATTVRTLLELSWTRDGDVLTATVRADAFCHHMVRSLVGCLLAVGDGRRPVDWPAEVLAAAARHPAVTVVPADGLTLEEVGYPPDGELAARADETRATRGAGMSSPPPEVLDAFGATGVPVLLEGGMGRTWRAGDVVLKPVTDVVEHAWVAEVYDAWQSDEVRVPQPLKGGGGWSFAGWGAHVFVPGVIARVDDDPGWFRAACDAFHDAVADLARPAFLDDRDDPWSYGDRVAWEGAPVRGHPRTVSVLERALALMEPIDLPAQVVHGDLCVNVLRDGDRPGVIDWPAYHRPRGWAHAVVATDAIRWEGADLSLLDRWEAGAAWTQLLLRAVVYRLATRAWLEAAGTATGEEDGYSIGNAALLEVLEERLR